MNNFTISVIICTYNRTDDLCVCLKSLESQLIKPDEVIIVDDGNAAETEKMLIKLNSGFKMFKHVKNKVKKGLPAARNTGIKHAQGDIICFIDDDVILPPNWLFEIINCYKERPEIVGAGGSLINLTPFRNDMIYKISSILRLLFFSKKVGKLSYIGFPYCTLSILYGNYKIVDTLTGCNMSFIKEVFDSHRFDESYSGSAWGEELDFCTVLSKKERKTLIYNPKAFLIHNRTQEGGCRTDNTLFWLIRNNTYFLLKNFNLKYLRLIIFAILISPYVIFTFRFRSLNMFSRAIKEGIKQYKEYLAK